MRRCGTVAALFGVAIAWIAYAVLALVICVVFALPFVMMFVLDALLGDRGRTPAVPPMLPPRRARPVAVGMQRAA